jgi:threonine synthase
VIGKNESVVAVLTGHVLKDTDYVIKYHHQSLTDPDGRRLESPFDNSPIRVAASADAIREVL